MALIGNQLSSAENNSYRVLDNLASFTLTFDGSSSANVLASTDTIALSQHPFVTGQRVTYSSGGGSPIGGLLSGTAYYITKTDQNSFKLASSYVNAITNINIDLVGAGTGVTHSFNVAFDGVNTKFKATYSNGTKCTISRAAQLDIAINGVVQQPYDSNPPPNGFTIEADATIVFSTAPLSGYTFWGKALSGSTASFETSDNSIDNFTGDGSTTNFTLSKTPANSQNVLVTINGVTQYPSDATGTRSYSTNANVLVFTAAPGNGSSIQVRYIGFAGPTSSNVTGFYGRTGNVVLNSSDGIGVGTAKIGTGIVGLATALLVEGNVRITGILTIGTSSITLNGSTDTISARTVSTGSTVSIGSSTIVVGNNFIGNNSIGLGATTTTGRNAGINTVAGTLIYNSSAGTVQFYNGNRWVPTSEAYIEATGGTISDYTEGNTIYRAHIFTSSSTFSVTSSPSGASVEYLVVAGGGGGGGGWQGGGGGAGGFRTGTGIPVSALPGSYAITIGAGGLGGTDSDISSNGGDSIFSTITSTGGGRGAGERTASSDNPANTGGSGGGGSHGNPSPVNGSAGNTPPVSPPQGNSGGNGISSGGPPSVYAGGGGGGAGSIGGNATPTSGGVGGNGASSSISGTPVTYAGGGGGSLRGSTGGSGGPGGGGAGGQIGSTGTYSTGGGGGAGSDPPAGRKGAAGGSGIVVVRYQIGVLAATAKATGGAISYSGGKTIHTFLSSGTFTVTSPGLSSVDYLVVAGGGGATSYFSGGGGAGGFRTGTGFPVSTSPGAYTITVGAGGAGNATATGPSAGIGANGIDSVFAPGYPGVVTSTGGGGGASRQTGGAGGSGGGGGNANTSGGAGTPGQGNSGGNGNGTGGASDVAAGGGGGATAAGTSGVYNTTRGVGGAGTPSSITGITTHYAGGGGGGSSGSLGSVRTSGGSGGGGNGGGGPGYNPIYSGTNGNTSTGGGGGGGGEVPGTGGSGGSGIVIIAYPS